MKNLKLIAALGLAIFAIGLFNVESLKAVFPSSLMVTNVNQNDEPINDAALIGRKYLNLSNSTTETLVCASPCVVDAILMSSGATSNYLILSDSTTAAGNGNKIAWLAMPGANANSQSFIGAPIGTRYGLTVDASAADGYSATVVYHMK